MSMMRTFGEALVGARRSQGYASARAFYGKCGGRRALGMSYPAYLALERGKSLPRPKSLRLLLVAMTLLPGSPQRAVLLESYLESLIQDPDMAAEMLGRRVSGPEGPADEAARMVVRESVNLDLKQWKLLATDFACLACNYYLQCTSGFVTAEDIAKDAGLTLPDTRRALRQLAAVGLAKILGNRARGPNVGKLVNIPALSPATAGLYAAVRRHRDRLIHDGRRRYDWSLLGRIPTHALERYSEFLLRAVQTATLYCDPIDRRGEVCIVQARITRVFSKRSADA